MNLNLNFKPMKTVRQTINWLGPTRTYIIFFLLAFTGLASLMLNAVIANAPKGQNMSGVTIIQSLLVVTFLFGAAVTIMSRVPAQERRQLMLILAPALMAAAIGLFNPTLLPFFGPLGVAWVVLSLLLIRGRVRREYQDAIKHLRKGEYGDAVKVMNGVIEKEPDHAQHYRFRAELFRLWGKIKRARADYEKVIELDPESAVGYNGLAEVYLQDSEFENALTYAKKALERDPNQWVAPYNLGMIEDRLGLWADSAQHLQQALKVGIPDSRHRLLTHLWMARAFYQEGKTGEANTEIDQMKREKPGLEEWKKIFENDAAAVLRDVLQQDVDLAQQLVEDQAAAEVLAVKS